MNSWVFILWIIANYYHFDAPIVPYLASWLFCGTLYCSLPGSSIHGTSRQEYWSELPFPSPGDLPNPGIEPRSPALQADSLPAEPQGKPKNPGVGSLSLLQWIFPTWELNHGLLHCRRILYQLSYALLSGTNIQGCLKVWKPTYQFSTLEMQYTSTPLDGASWQSRGSHNVLIWIQHESPQTYMLSSSPH